MQNGYMYIFGGFSNDIGYSSDVYMLRVPEGSETEWVSPVVEVKNDAPPHPRTGHSLTRVGDAVYSIGGTTRDRPMSGDTIEIRPDPSQPTHLKMNILDHETIELLEGLTNHASVAVQAPGNVPGILITGGNLLECKSSQVHFLDCSSKVVRDVRVLGKPLPPITHHASFVVSSREGDEVVAYVFGGLLDSRVTNQTFRLSLGVMITPRQSLGAFTEKEALSHHVTSFSMVFAAAPPPKGISPNVYHAFLEDTVAKFETETTGASPAEPCVTHLHVFTEKLLMHRLFSTLWEIVASDEIRVQDQLLSQKCSILSNFVTADHLDVITTRVNGHPWTSAQQTLARVRETQLPIEKIAHVMRCCALIHESLGWPSGADDFLPVLIFVVICANVPNLHHELAFVYAFAPMLLVTKGEEAYYLTQLSCAVTFATSVTSSSLKMPEETFIELVGDDIGIFSDSRTETEGYMETVSDLQNRSDEHASNEGSEKWWSIWTNEPNQAAQNASISLENSRKFEKIEKQGFFNRSWKIRWLSLFDNMLAYYDAPSDANLKGTISLQHAIVRQFTDRNQGGFEVVVPGRTYRFRTEDSRMAQTWQDEIARFSTCSVMVSNSIPHTLTNQPKKLRISSRFPLSFLSSRNRSPSYNAD